jgi:hypothetical protein
MGRHHHENGNQGNGVLQPGSRPRGAFDNPHVVRGVAQVLTLLGHVQHGKDRELASTDGGVLTRSTSSRAHVS